MTKQFIKANDFTIEEQETKVVSVKHDLKNLKIRRQNLVLQIARIDKLILEATKLGVVERESQVIAPISQPEVENK